MSRTIDLYLVQDPATAFPADDNTRGYNRGLLDAYDGSLAVRNIQHLIILVQMEVALKHAPVRNLVIGSHGAALGDGNGFFHIGENTLNYNDNRMLQFKVLRPLFAPDGAVFLLSCRTGRDATLLRQVSRCFGGIPVHGYTDYITTTNYLFLTTVDDGTDDEGSEIVCWPNRCRDITLNKDVPGPPDYVSAPKF
jgi:hypothetical protein